ncbi:MAG TPA: PilZ domain-containing protein [Myxococcota bacterium]|jgi:uncharacterized protein (TIGR02266 family)
MKSSRRQADRVVVNREFHSIEEFISEYVSDISRTGVFIRSDDPLPVGTKVDLRFTVIDEDFETIEGIGEVTRVVAPGGTEPPGMGVVFVELTSSSQTLVERLLIRRGA